MVVRVLLRSAGGPKIRYALPRSLVIHSRMYAGQSLSLILSASQLLRNLTASRSTRVRSFKSKTMRRPSASLRTCASNSAMFSTSIRPLSFMTISPFTSLVIFSTHPLLRILPSVRFVAHSYNGNHSANPKLWKIGSLMGIHVAIFRNVAKSRNCALGFA
jgi:hypothetical protein